MYELFLLRNIAELKPVVSMIEMIVTLTLL